MFISFITNYAALLDFFPLITNTIPKIITNAKIENNTAPDTIIEYPTCGALAQSTAFFASSKTSCGTPAFLAASYSFLALSYVSFD